MFRNYFKTAWRGLRSNTMYSFINITGLAAGLAVSILLLLWVSDELSYDRFNVNAENIYRLAPKFDDQNIWSETPAPAAVYAKKDLPEVSDACRIRDNHDVSIFEYNGKRFTESHNCLADASLFSMFTFPFVEGNPQHPFTDAHSVVLSETTAKTFFGNEDPMGKVLKADAAIAFPLAWYGLKGFLQGYAYRTALSWWVFVIAGLITLLIAMFTVSFKCVQAALANPVKSLRTE